MIRTLHSARRSLRAALAAGRHMVSAAISAHHRLLVRLAEACDTRAVVRIRYTDSKGVQSERGITPRRLWVDSKGHTLVTAFDHRDQDQANFRTDRITIDPKETAMATVAHPLVAHIPATDLRGTITQTIPAGEGVVTVATTNPTWGAFEVTAWRPVPQWEIDMLAAEFPGEYQPRAVSVSSCIVQDDAGIGTAITEVTEFLDTYLARVTFAEVA